jgi:hypothetical protein
MPVLQMATTRALRRPRTATGSRLSTLKAFPETDWLDRLVDAAESRPEYGFFGSLLLRADDPGEVDSTGDAYHVGGMA